MAKEGEIGLSEVAQAPMPSETSGEEQGEVITSPGASDIGQNYSEFFGPGILQVRFFKTSNLPAFRGCPAAHQRIVFSLLAAANC